MPPIPAFIRQADLRNVAIHFRWDEWDIRIGDEPVDKGLAESIAKLSQRASLAFTIVSAWWVLERFALLVDETLPLQCVDVAWAQQIDFLYSWDWDLDDSWTGPVKGPIRVALDKVTWAVQEVRDYRHPAWAATTIANLVEYVLTDPSPYLRWRMAILDRIVPQYQLDPEDQWGDVVPPEAFDPGFPFDPEQTEALMNRLLHALDYRTNPLLRAPEAMRERGLKGTPYRFNMAEDRKQRIEW